MSVWPSDPILDFPIWSEFDCTVLNDDCNTWTFPSAWNETAEPNPDEEKLLEYVESSQAAPVCPAMGQRDSADQTHSPGSNDATTTVERNGMRVTAIDLWSKFEVSVEVVDATVAAGYSGSVRASLNELLAQFAGGYRSRGERLVR